MDSLTGGHLQAGNTANLTATPSLGYLFTGWSGDATGNNPLVVVMEANKTIGASFVKDERDNDGDGLSNYAELVLHNTDPIVPTVMMTGAMTALKSLRTPTRTTPRAFLAGG